MEYKRIEELTTVVTGGTPSTGKREYWDGGNIPWLQSGCCQNCDVNSTEKYITQEGYDNSSARIMPANTVMIALTGATAGKVGYLNFEACGNQSITGIFPCNSMNQRYLFYYLLSQREKILTDCVGGAQAHISQGYVKNIKVPVLPLSEQKQIVEVLTKLSTVISMQQNEIKTLDNLVKARFVEMFGDPIQNEKCWEIKSLFDLGYCKNGMNFHKGDHGVEIHCLGVGDFKDRSTIYDVKNLPYVALNESPDSDYLLQDGDIVFVRSNGNKELVGRCLAIYPENVPVTYSGFCIRYRLTSEKASVPYILRVLKADSVRKKMAGRGANIQNLNQQTLSQLAIPLPPLSLQNQFAAFVAEVDKSKLLAELFAQNACILAENRSK